MHSNFGSSGITMARFALLAAVLVLGTVGKTVADEPESVVGGFDVGLGELPYQVSLQIGNFHFCGGSIIDEYHILTAAHCVDDQTRYPYNFKVVTGTNNIRSGQRHEVANVQVHENYMGQSRNSWMNDVAVITVAAPIQMNKFQNTIRLATQDPAPNAALLLSGWGMLRARGPSPNILQKTTVYSLTNKECQSKHARQPIWKTHICSKSRVGVGACQGDSGGPLVWNGVQVGVVSWVYPCAFGYPDVYTRVSSYVDWIQNAVRRG